MAKRRKPSVSFSVDSLREEVEVELTNEKVATNVLQDLRSIRLDSVDFVSPDVLLCSLTVKFGRNNARSIHCPCSFFSSSATG